MNIKSNSQEQPANSLSEGNQQKIVAAKWLLTQSDIVFLDESTRGIDVGVKFEIYQLIQELAKEGKAVLMISSEMPELLGMCGRIAVLKEGRPAGELLTQDATQENIMAAIVKGQCLRSEVMLKSKDKKPGIKKTIPKMGTVFVLTALIILWSSLSQSLFTANNLLLIIKQVSPYSILCVGMTIVLVTGGIGLSIGSIIALFAVFAARYCSGDYLNIPLYIPIIIAVSIGTACGVTNEPGVAHTRILLFIMTMCMMLVARGAAYVHINAKTIFNLNGRLVNISNGFLRGTYSADGIIDNYGIPYMISYFAGAVIIGVLTLHFTTYGYRAYASGSNKSAARYSGINTQLIEYSAYAISGLCAGIYGFLMASRTSSGNVNPASGYEMTVIFAAVIGGVLLSGGVGTMYGVMVGVLIVGIISNGMDILGINIYFQQILQTVITFVITYIDVCVSGKKKQKVKYTLEDSRSTPK